MTKFIIYEQVGDKAYPHYFKSKKDFYNERKKTKKLIETIEKYSSGKKLTRSESAKLGHLHTKVFGKKLKKVI